MRMLYILSALLIKTMQSRDTADSFGLRTQLKREEAYQQTKSDVAFAGMFGFSADPQRGVAYTRDDPTHFESWYESAKAVGMQATMLHDSVYSDEFAYKNSDLTLSFAKMDAVEHGLHSNPDRKDLTPADWRFVAFYDYLVKHREKLDYVILTDAVDVVFRKDPLKYMRGLDSLMNHQYVYGQDEWRPWLSMDDHFDPVKVERKSPWGRMKAYYKSCFGSEMPVEAFAGRLPNCGILGGHVDVVIPFLEQMLKWYATIRQQKRFLMCDMLVYMRTIEENYGDRFISGYPFHAKFKHNDPLEFAVIYHKSMLPMQWEHRLGNPDTTLQEDLPVPNEDDWIDNGHRYKENSTRRAVF